MLEVLFECNIFVPIWNTNAPQSTDQKGHMISWHYMAIIWQSLLISDCVINTSYFVAFIFD